MDNRPWLNEPDRVEFEYKGYPCVILRAHPKAQNEKDWLGSLCGYVALPREHPYYGKGYEQIEIDVHGGLTYCNERLGDLDAGNVWWIGFDCAHLGDLVPAIWEMRQRGGILHDIHMAFGERSHEIYRDIGFVENEIKCLVDQLENEMKMAAE